VTVDIEVTHSMENPEDHRGWSDQEGFSINNAPI